MGVFLLCYHAIVPSASKGDISASANCYLQRFSFIDWYIGKPSYAFSCHFDFLSCRSIFYLLRHVHSQGLGEKQYISQSDL